MADENNVQPAAAEGAPQEANSAPQGGQQGGNAQSNDVWSTPGGSYDDETPF